MIDPRLCPERCRETYGNNFASPGRWCQFLKGHKGLHFSRDDGHQIHDVGVWWGDEVEYAQEVESWTA